LIALETDEAVEEFLALENEPKENTKFFSLAPETPKLG